MGALRGELELQEQLVYGLATTTANVAIKEGEFMLEVIIKKKLHRITGFMAVLKYCNLYYIQMFPFIQKAPGPRIIQIHHTRLAS